MLLILTLSGPPTIHSISSKLTSFEGEKVNLTCSASNDIDASEPLTIFWYGPRGTQLTSDMKNVNIYYKDDSITAQNTSILLMDTVNNTDTGQYTCRAFNHPKSYSEKKTSLDVECKMLPELLYSFLVNNLCFSQILQGLLLIPLQNKESMLA